MTKVRTNGSRFAGQEPATLEELYALLQTEPLDPRYAVTDFCARTYQAGLLFHGNFFRVSHAFEIETDDKDVIDTMITLIRLNMKSVAYLDARDVRQCQADAVKYSFGRNRSRRTR